MMFSSLNSNKHLLYKFTEVWGLRQNTTIDRSKFEVVNQTWKGKKWQVLILIEAGALVNQRGRALALFVKTNNKILAGFYNWMTFFKT